MDSIALFKKRMVYPEKLEVDPMAGRVRSWCEGQLESASGNEPEAARLEDSEEVTERRNADFSKNFIQKRLRLLVNAFSQRTEKVKQHLDLPPTPSSISSPETESLDESQGQRSPELQPLRENTPPRQRHCFWHRLRQLYLTVLFEPEDRTYVIWMCIVTVAYLYNCWVIPLRSTFPYQTPENRHIWMCFDYTADLVYLLDLLLVQPRIKYISDGFWIQDLPSTCKNYVVNKTFKRDLISLAPTDILFLIFGPERVYLRFPRLLKFHSFAEFFSHIDRLISSPHIVRITRTLVYMMYMIHLNACSYYAISAWEGLGSNTFVFSGRGNAYVVCFYFATKTATSIGKNPKPKLEAELVFMTASWLMGVFVFALLIGQIRDIIATATRTESEFRRLVDETMKYMRRLNMPLDAQKRVQMWFNYTWETQHTLDENRILDWLPHKIKTDVAINVHIQTLGKVRLFADCDEALLRELVLKLRPEIYLPRDLICRKGDVGKEMYIVRSGCVEVVAADGQVLATLVEGSVFGEISLLEIGGMNRRTADVRSKGFSNLFVLSKSDLNDALIHYPDAQQILNRKARSLMRKNASMEEKKEGKAIIVIENPSAAPKLLDAVLQIIPSESGTDRLLRYGSTGLRRADPATLECSVTVHRTMSSIP